MNKKGCQAVLILGCKRITKKWLYTCQKRVHGLCCRDCSHRCSEPCKPIIKGCMYYMTRMEAYYRKLFR